MVLGGCVRANAIQGRPLLWARRTCPYSGFQHGSTEKSTSPAASTGDNGLHGGVIPNVLPAKSAKDLEQADAGYARCSKG